MADWIANWFQIFWSYVFGFGVDLRRNSILFDLVDVSIRRKGGQNSPESFFDQISELELRSN